MMTARAAFGVLLVAGVLGCQSMQTRVGDHLPAGKFIDNTKSGVFHTGTMSVGKQRDLTLQRASGLGLVPAPQLQAYLQSVLQRVVAVSPVSGIPANVHIRASEEFGALSTADANIFVNLGLVRSLDSEDQVAFVLAHELSHIILGHTSTEIVAKTQRQAAVLTELGLAVGTQVRAAQGKGGMGGMTGDSKLKEQNQLLLLNTLVLSPAWTRGQEREADLLGTDLLVRAGYSPSAVDEVLAKLVEVEAKPDRVTLSTAVERMKTVDWVGADQVAAAPQGASAEQIGSSWLDSTIKKVGQVATDTAGDKMKEMQEDHPRAVDRRADMQKYIAREYSAAAASNSEALRKAFQEPSTQEILSHYEQAYQAGDFVESNNLKAAEKLAQLSVGGSTANHAYTRYYFSVVREGQGDTRKAIQNLELAYSSPEPALRIYQSAAELHEQLGERAKAIQLLEQANRQFGEPPNLLPDLIQIYRRAGRTSDADRLALQCATKYPEMKEACAGKQE
jgi:predicted Zn-dependent protease